MKKLHLPLFPHIPFHTSFSSLSPYFSFLSSVIDCLIVRQQQLHSQLRTATDSIQKMRKIGQVQVFDQLFDELFDLRTKSGTFQLSLPCECTTCLHLATDTWQPCAGSQVKNSKKTSMHDDEFRFVLRNLLFVCSKRGTSK